jgi:hypothetical protein
MLYNPPPHLRHLTHQQFLATPEGREQTEGMRRFYAEGPDEWRGQNNTDRRVTHAVTVSNGRVTPYSPQPPQSPSMPPRPQPQSMPPRPGQSQRGPAQAGQAPRPGQAQSQQPQPQGTPYNPQQGGNFSAYSPQQGSSGYGPQQGGNFSGYGPQQGSSGYGPQQGGGFSAWDPNIANNAQAPRPPAFQASYGQMGGGYSDQPDTPQRDAFISQVNNQLGQMQGQSWQQPTGAPQFNFGQMMGQANQMVDQGFQNRFSMQPNRPSPSAAPMYAPGTSQEYDDGPRAGWPERHMEQFPDTGRPPPPQDNAAAIRNLLQGFNIPPNVMEQIGGLFGGQQPSPQPQQGSAPGTAQPAQDPYKTSRPSGPQRLLIDQRRSRQQPQQRASPGSGVNAIERIAADPNLTPSEKANKFMAASKQSLDNQTFKHSDIDLLRLPAREAKLLKNRASLHQRSIGNFQEAKEVDFAFKGKGGAMSRKEYDAAMRRMRQLARKD